MRKRTSSIWTTPKKELAEIVKDKNTFSDILRSIGLDPYGSGSRYRSLKQRLKKEEIDFSHISLGSFSRLGKKFPSSAISLEKVMVKNSTYSRGHLKERLLKNGMLENKCSNCGQLPLWDNRELVMVLDHINGTSNDHRLENLRLLCPNCNSQTKTFAGKRNKKLPIMCKECGAKEVSRRSKTELCRECYNK